MNVNMANYVSNWVCFEFLLSLEETSFTTFQVIMFTAKSLHVRNFQTKFQDAPASTIL